jgi:hypothetical protein
MTDAFQDLKGIIRKSGMTPEQIAVLSRGGVSGQTIRNWLSGRVREARADSMVVVAEIFDMTLELRLVNARPIIAAPSHARRPVPRMSVWMRS